MYEFTLDELVILATFGQDSPLNYDLTVFAHQVSCLAMSPVI